MQSLHASPSVGSHDVGKTFVAVAGPALISLVPMAVAPALPADHRYVVQLKRHFFTLRILESGGFS